MIGFDTNVLIYACDQSEPGRQRTALDLIEAACLEAGVTQFYSEDLPGRAPPQPLEIINPFT